MIGEALRLVRVYHDQKQSDLAERLGIVKSYLSEIERGEKKPTLALLEKYAQEFRLPISSILFFAESIESKEPFDRSRTFVASKILKLLQFLEDRANDKK
ncbi:MAG: hypothetical protein BroJett024_02810 [Alphaproteobacteria bacterium]|nr:MAG: hypothetical protein BroJett024_02810 [Alphaproteobacteria bacterium]